MDMHFVSESSTPKKKDPFVYMDGLLIDVSHYLGLSSPDLKCILTPIDFFVGTWLYMGCIPWKRMGGYAFCFGEFYP